MADWDEDSIQSRNNLRELLSTLRSDARARAIPTVEAARGWHIALMRNLTVPYDAGRFTELVGKFRGETGLEDCEVVIGGHLGVAPGRIAEQLKSFEETLQGAVETLDSLIVPHQGLDADQFAAVIDLCAWAHSEWIRIHPFANGSGRTARLWANTIAMRYTLPPFVRLRPRPDHPYGFAAADAMEGRWQPTARIFRQMVRDAIKGLNN